jgi:hypothetical protein
MNENHGSVESCVVIGHRNLSHPKSESIDCAVGNLKNSLIIVIAVISSKTKKIIERF